MIDMKYKQVYCNVLAKVIHNGVELANHKNYQSLALLLIFFFNHNSVVCCGFAYSNNNKGTGIAELFKKNIKSITGDHLTDIMGIIVAYQEDIGVSTQLDLSER